ncbi:hypothetical protein K449DRAFT_380352 [Hypoxylon sp. EC38]|nr:hypothetical protein K449DRAFT_380352 [Hypoxylon sp. EC38]
MPQAQVRCKMEPAPVDESTFSKPSLDAGAGASGSNIEPPSEDWMKAAAESAAASAAHESGAWQTPANGASRVDVQW